MTVRTMPGEVMPLLPNLFRLAGRVSPNVKSLGMAADEVGSFDGIVAITRGGLVPAAVVARV